MTAPSPEWPTNREWARERDRKLAACRSLLTVADAISERKVRTEPAVVLEEWTRATKTYRAAPALLRPIGADGAAPSHSFDDSYTSAFAPRTK
jgi:hypothetical protein